MAYRVFWTEIARDDLCGIVGFIANDNPPAAERFGLELIERAKAVSHFPQMGRQVPKIADPRIREVIHGAYRIVYEIDESREVVVISRIWHSARGSPKLR